MSDCLHCDINDLVREYLEQGDGDLAAISAKVAESLVDVIQMAPEGDQAKMMADALAFFGQVYLEKTGAAPGESDARH